MILNRINIEKEEEDIKENNEEKRVTKEKDEKGEKEEEEENEDEEGEEEEDDENENQISSNNISNNNEKYNDNENDYEDSHRKKMLRPDETEENISTLKNKIFYYKIFSITLIILVTIIILLIIFVSRKGKRKNLIFGKQITVSDGNTEAKLSQENINTIKNELNNAYNNGEINIIKFYEEFVNKKTYSPPDKSRYKSIHIALGFNEKDIDNIIKHIASAIYHASMTTFIHIHMMDADTFSYESLIKLKNMIYKINNNSEVIVYNAAESSKIFSIKDGAIEKFAKEYAKLSIFKLIKNVPIIILLDADDCMVQKDLSELYNLDMNDIYGRGIPEIPSIRYPVDWMEKYIYDKSHFINGGVILINLELCQKEDFYQKARELNNNEFYTKTEDPVQDILSILMRRKIEFFNPKFNKINYYENPEDKTNEQKWYPWVTETLKQSEKSNHFYTKEELMAADNDPVIIHYAWEKQLNKVIKKYEDDKTFYGQLVGLD